MFSKQKIRTILKDNGAKRIAEKSIDLMNEIITKIAEEIAFGAVKLTHLRGAKTIQKDAIRVSTRQFLGKKLDNEEVNNLEGK